MSLDVSAAQISPGSILLAAISLHLTLTTLLQYDTRAGRIISVAYITVTGTGVLTASLPGDGSAPALGALAAAGITLSFGLLRSGLRLQQLGHSHQLRWALGAAAVTGVSAVVVPSTQEQSVPLALAVVFSAGFAAAAVLDSLRGPRAERPSARVLQAVMGLVAGSIVVISSMIVVGVVDWDESIDVTVAIGTTTAFTLAALCVTTLRAEDARATWWGDDARGKIADFEIPGAAAFRRDAEDRIQRSNAAGAAVGLVWVEIDDLDDLETVFGPAVRDRAVVHVGRVLRNHVPPFALLGHLGDGRFAVLTTARARRPVERVASAVHTGLQERPDDIPVLIGCRIGASVGQSGPMNLDRLLSDAQARARRSAAADLRDNDPA